MYWLLIYTFWIYILRFFTFFCLYYNIICFLVFYSREEYENVAFLFISDDMAWGKKNIKNKNKDLVNI